MHTKSAGLARLSLSTPVAILLLVSALAPPAAAWGKEHRSSKGYTVDVPDGWEVASAELQSQITAGAQEVLQAMGGVDLRQVDTVLFRPPPDAFVENVNVIVGPGTPPIDSGSAKEVEQAVGQELRRAGMQAAGLQTRRETVAGREVLFSRWEVDAPAALVAAAGAAPTRLRQWQVLVPGRTRHYIITCSADASNFPEAEFNHILNNFRFDDPAPTTAGGFWSNVGGGAVRGAIIGGLVGLVVFVIHKLKKMRAGPGA